MNDNKTNVYEQKKEELNDLTRQLHEGIREYIGSERYTAVLDSISRFHKYSLNNSIIIRLQKPDATRVASFKDWKSLNRTVNKGEQGIKIFYPIKYRKEVQVVKKDAVGNEILDENGNRVYEKKLAESLTFKIGYVFDVSQTSQIEGKKEYPLSFVEDLKFDIEDFDIYMKAVQSVAQVPLEIKKFDSNAKGYFSDLDKKIVIQSGMSEAQTFKTAIHELAHSYLHSKDSIDANSITFCVAECMEFPRLSLAEYHDDLTLEEAVRIYQNIPSERMNAGKGIGFELHDESIYADGMFPLVQNDQIQIDAINTVKYYRESFAVQKAIMDLREYFPDDGYTLKNTRELQAESVAYIVCKHYGIDTSDYSFGYVTSWLEDENQLMKNLDAIKSCSSEIIEKMDTSLKQSFREKYGIHTPEEMAVQLDRFLQDYDMYEYRDQEIYPGSIFEETLQNIKEGNTEHIEKFLKETISDNRDVKMTEKGKELLKCLKTFQKLISLELLKQSRGRGMTR